ncbi:phosphatase PAP2 family protein [Hymenobacter glacialis]|uniref:Phosphatidic acid phosphatase type 2/haloperoxidase domain-containing protein n=1 Tax=Hymenobacter glacialis TaxID=1908236 RepID=A0A1G1T7V8_9BACT|nr:phosphatase PAP2 family protein [Hymenobacter glacialis]OGX86947.1 hypothetical protein BEN48_00900 [Hymenobacter glacialis]
MLETIKQLDRQLLLAINHLRSPALDAVMVFASDRQVWLPVYALLIGWFIYVFRRRAILLLPLVLAAVGLADLITSRLFKPFFARLRPCHDAAVFPYLYLPDGCGGQFGFLSSHASNSMALAVFMGTMLPKGRFKVLRLSVFGWAVLLSYSRVYLGAHYPTDVLGGALLGGLLGVLAGFAYRYWAPRWQQLNP